MQAQAIPAAKLSLSGIASNKNEEFEMRFGRAPAHYRQIAGFGVGSGIAPVTTVSGAVSSSTGGR